MESRFNIFAATGRIVLAFMAQIGRLAVFTGDAVSCCFRPPVYWYLIDAADACASAISLCPSWA